jgi:catechol 2,3-dioxygenase-like lactoylglutathione lyase family enzyme
MFDHVTIRASDREATERFYALVLRTLGVEPPHTDEYYAQWADFSLAGATEESPATSRLHIAFVAPSRAYVDEFWRVGTEAGYRDDGAPGRRPQYSESYYGAFLLDPDGNSAEAVHHDHVRSDGCHIDHLWIRVADVAGSKRFYELVAEHAGFRLAYDAPTRVRFAADPGSFSLVAGNATQNVHMAFPVDDNGTVDAFHRAAIDAGYRDNGPPGERPIYHSGYYGAFVLDPEGNNVELVNHNRSS